MGYLLARTCLGELCCVSYLLMQGHAHQAGVAARQCAWAPRPQLLARLSSAHSVVCTDTETDAPRLAPDSIGVKCPTYEQAAPSLCYTKSWLRTGPSSPNLRRPMIALAYGSSTMLLCAPAARSSKSVDRTRLWWRMPATFCAATLPCLPLARHRDMFKSGKACMMGQMYSMRRRMRRSGTSMWEPRGHDDSGAILPDAEGGSIG